MIRRTRTTKALARRIDLEYFARPHPFRRWRFALSVAVPAMAVIWFFAQRAHGGPKVYSSGPLARSHAVFTKQCGLCHLRNAGVFFLAVDDKACLACHEGPLHHPNQAFTPTCSSCHVEHKGAMRLSATADLNCIQCHSSLHTRQGEPKYEVSILGFEKQHPEFRLLRSGTGDPGRIKLNHYLHLQPNLIGPNQSRVQMTCDDCHRTAGARDSLPYPGTSGQLKDAAASQKSESPALPGKPRAYMAAPEFARHCAGCHLLNFDRRFGDEPVPHDKPDVVRRFLASRFGEYIATHPAEIHQIDRSDRVLPGRPNSLKIARSAAEWVQFRVEDAEWLLYRKTCKQCHTVLMGASPPEIARSQITRRWLEHAEFDHFAHRAVACASCHVKAVNSRETSDVLIPGIATCRACHRQEGPAQDSAEGRCFECHQYHDWSKATRTKGIYTIPELRGFNISSLFGR